MKTFEREARQVRSIHVSGWCRVSVIRGTAERVAITADNADGIALITTRYEGDTLVIESVNHGAVVSGRGSTVIAGNGSIAAGGDIYINGDSQGRRETEGAVHAGGIAPFVEVTVQTIARVLLSGSGNVSLRYLDQPEVELQLDGSGDITVDGAVDHVQIALSGSGDVDASGLRARTASLHLVGSGDIRAHATDAAMSRLTGSGDIVVHGNPPSRDGQVSGSGDIRYR